MWPDRRDFTHQCRSECSQSSGWPTGPPENCLQPCENSAHPVGPALSSIKTLLQTQSQPSQLPPLWDLFIVWASRQFHLQFSPSILILGQIKLSIRDTKGEEVCVGRSEEDLTILCCLQRHHLNYCARFTILESCWSTRNDDENRQVGKNTFLLFRRSSKANNKWVLIYSPSLPLLYWGRNKELQWLWVLLRCSGVHWEIV